MTIMMKITASLMVLLGIYIVAMNCYAQLQNYRNKKRGIEKFISPLPFIGPILICFGYNLFGLPFNGLIFLVFLLDPGTLITIISLPWLFIGLFSKEERKP